MDLFWQSNVSVFYIMLSRLGFPRGSEVKVSASNAGDLGLIPGSGGSPGEGNGNPLAWRILPGDSHGQRSLVGYSPRGSKESDMTERLHFHFQVGHNFSFKEQASFNFRDYLILQVRGWQTMPAGQTLKPSFGNNVEWEQPHLLIYILSMTAFTDRKEEIPQRPDYPENIKHYLSGSLWKNCANFSTWNVFLRLIYYLLLIRIVCKSTSIDKNLLKMYSKVNDYCLIWMQTFFSSLVEIQKVYIYRNDKPPNWSFITL